jgi:RNA polymerase sigma factor (sigma-70 family)
LSGDGGKARISAQDWETLYRKYFPKLGRYFASKGLSAAEAEDLAHDVFQELGRGKVPEDSNRYICAIARNILARHRRHKIAEHGALDEYCRRVTADNRRSSSHALDTGPSREAPTAEAERILRTVVAKLSPKDAELVTLRFIEQLSIKQVAQRTNCSENAVSKRLQKLRPILRRLYRE